MSDQVEFTDYTVRKSNLLATRMKNAPFPSSWVMVAVKKKIAPAEMTHWIMKNTEGRFGIVNGHYRISIFFEDEMDAVMFKMKDGDKFDNDSSQHL